ncbi:hypothetical protein PHLCEN_2v9574 [Hermanssonia centrifuga]|uniref:DUF6535 domain-containing protein n=1 Tax=Hermanssonia centrifuga TaxID=98765 RepID=A0A2R6NQG2_9APHY|nr:hypothetical protein PHLCEN_2v9574 [Hermanssonia centrifuga]
MGTLEEQAKAKGPAETNTPKLKTGWSAIEDYAWKNDEQSMKIFSEDIDTLLVFAGLFSAVLTAFVVPAYGMLQQDNVQVSADFLARISAKLDSFQITPSFINSTASPNPSASGGSVSSFTVSTSARWINILWFLSLLFSLSSALFGILAKQWIREYLQWNQTTASPRENILLRQLRSEAWVKWKVPAGIAAIPALLEVAVVLFLLGLIVFLWTLDFVVALVINIAAGVILIIAFVVTTLPAFFQHCPYKSPTGWACVFIYDIVTRSIYRIRRRFESRFFDELPYFPSWRHRDLYIDRKVSMEINNRMGLSLRRRHIPNDIRDTAQLRPLVQALALVHQASEDPHLSSEVVRCLDTLPTHDSDSARWELQMFGTLYTLWKLCSQNGGMVHFPRVEYLVDAFFEDAGGQIVHGYTLSRGLHVETYDTCIPYRSFTDPTWIALCRLDSSKRRLLINLILADLEACITSKPWHTIDEDGPMINRRMRWIMIYIRLLEDLTWTWDTDVKVSDSDELCGRLIQMCNRVPMAANALAYSAYLYGILLRSACKSGRVCTRENTKELSAVGEF